MMNVNFILTCTDREEYIPHMISILANYRKIFAQFCVCYNGDKNNIYHQVNRKYLVKSFGDSDLTIAGYDYLIRQNDGYRFIKLSIDSWLLDGDKIIAIFEEMEKRQVPYAGNRWHGADHPSLSTDIFFADTRFGNVFTELPVSGEFEVDMWKQVERIGKGFYTIPEREPVHDTYRVEVPDLKWTMHHELEKNLRNQREWAK